MISGTAQTLLYHAKQITSVVEDNGGIPESAFTLAALMLMQMSLDGISTSLDQIKEQLETLNSEGIGVFNQAGAALNITGVVQTEEI